MAPNSHLQLESLPSPPHLSLSLPTHCMTCMPITHLKFNSPGWTPGFPRDPLIPESSLSVNGNSILLVVLAKSLKSSLPPFSHTPYFLCISKTCWLSCQLHQVSHHFPLPPSVTSRCKMLSFLISWLLFCFHSSPLKLCSTQQPDGVFCLFACLFMCIFHQWLTFNLWPLRCKKNLF